MKREWKPGDVAVDPADDLRAMVVGPARSMGCPSHHPNVAHWHYANSDWNPIDVDSLRPLVVIDPEDRKQVERLAKAMHESDHIAPWHDLHNETRAQIEDAMQAALRSLIASPKPEEPTGLGAVVEDAEGNRWVRVQTPGASEWLRVDSAREGDNFGYRKYRDINAVEVLSDGVQP